MRFYCKNIAYCYFREYTESLLREKDKVILFEDNEKVIIEDDNISNIFLSFIPPYENIELNYKNNNKINLFYLNTEQATRVNVKYFVLNNLSILNKFKEKYNDNVNVGIIDYSNQNIKLLQDMNFLDMNFLDSREMHEIHYIPYQFNENENNKLKQFLKSSKKIDIAYCGTDSKYRYDILNKIEKKYMGINICSGFSDDRDSKIAESKVLINIHFEKSYNIYESIRCDRWIFAGHLVLSESTIDDKLIDLIDCMIMCKGEDMTEHAEKIIKKYDIYKKLYIINKTLIRNQVIQKRKELYDDFRSKFN